MKNTWSFLTVVLLLAASAEAGESARELTVQASGFQDRGIYADAESAYLRAIAANPSFTPALNGLASLYFETRQWSRAEKYTKQCLAISQTAQQLGNLAAVYQNERRYDEAEVMYRKAVELFEREGRENTAEMAFVLHNLASLRVSGDPEQAAGYAERALAIWATTPGADSAIYAQGLAHLAFIYTVLGRSADADKLWKQSLAILESTVGRSSPVYVRLARAYRHRHARPLPDGAPGEYTVDFRDLGSN